LKGEDRELVLLPRHLRARRIPRGLRLSFALPRGGYALLVVQRMLAESGASSERRPRSRPPDSRSPGSRSTRPPLELQNCWVKRDFSRQNWCRLKLVCSA
jgi:hypothetical protein